AEDGVREARLLRRLVPEPRAEPRDHEARSRGEDAGRVECLREEVPGRDEAAGRAARSRSPGGALALGGLLGRLLLRGRVALPPRRAAGAARRARREGRIDRRVFRVPPASWPPTRCATLARSLRTTGPGRPPCPPSIRAV